MSKAFGWRFPVRTRLRALERRGLRWLAASRTSNIELNGGASKSQRVRSRVKPTPIPLDQRQIASPLTKSLTHLVVSIFFEISISGPCSTKNDGVPDGWPRAMLSQRFEVEKRGLGPGYRGHLQEDHARRIGRQFRWNEEEGIVSVDDCGQDGNASVNQDARRGHLCLHNFPFYHHLDAMNLPEGFRVKPKSSSASRSTTMRAPTFFNSFAAAKAIEKGKEKETQRDDSSSKKPQPPVEFKRRPPPAYILDPALKRSLANDKQRVASKPSKPQVAAKSVLRPPSFALTSAGAQSKAAAKSQASSDVVYRTLPIPFFNAAAGPSTSKPPAQSSKKPSSEQGWKPLGIPKFILPSTKPAVDPEKLKNMVTPSTTKFALANNPMTEAGARGLAAIMAAHRAKNAEPDSSSWDRGMMMSPEKRDAKGRWKFVRCVLSC